jgi:hypothetical protein
MIRYAFPLAAIALAGCTTYYDPPPVAPVLSAGPAPVVSASPGATQRAGQGIIESISLASLPASASAGGTAPPAASGPYRVTVRMDDGNIQTLVVGNRAFLVGDRVRITPEGRLLRS